MTLPALSPAAAARAQSRAGAAAMRRGTGGRRRTLLLLLLLALAAWRSPPQGARAQRLTADAGKEPSRRAWGLSRWAGEPSTCGQLPYPVRSSGEQPLDDTAAAVLVPT